MRTIDIVMTQYFKALRLFAVAAVCALLAACSAMLIGGANQASPAIGGEHRSSAQLADDNSLARTVQSAFASDSLLSSERLHVSVANGVVTLSGVVGSFAARDRAVGVAGNVAGTSRVKSQLQVNTQH